MGGIELTTIKPVDWWSVIGLTIIGLAQIVAGAALAVLTVGTATHFGIGLVGEGVSDIITAVKDGIIHRDFSWSKWGCDKLVSMSVTIFTAGLGALK